jgi:predicted TPR repeat methyltransferase
MVRLSQARGAYDRPHFSRGAAMSGTFEQARDFFTQGLAHYQARRYTDAERSFAASAALLPGRVSTLTNLGAVRLKLGKPQDAADVLEEALAREPDNVEALGHRATALAELGDHSRALACVERVLALDASLGQAWSLRGQLLKALGRAQEAAAAFDEAIARGADAELNRYYRAALTGDVPPTAPRHYVQSLFDTYAEGFDEHLVQVLHYRAPQVLAQGLETMGRRFARALDLGCGTGLCGPLLRPMAKVLHGVDLSATMVQRATALGAYDQVVQSDLVAYLQQGEARYDLAVAADVFIYVGALEAVFEGVARVIEPGGVFCFSVERAPADKDLALQPSLRYAHSRGYIERLAAQTGFDVCKFSEQAVREDQRVPIPGLYFWLTRV